MKAVATQIGRLSRRSLRAPAVVACASITLFAGCAAIDAPQTRALHAAADHLHVVSSNRPDEAAAVAARQHEGDFVLSGVGESMRPCYAAGTAIVVHPTSYFMLRTGMPVVYMSRSGRQIAHVLLEESNRGWLAIGLNNSEPDDELVTARNLVGIITCAYVPTQASPGAFKHDSIAFSESQRTGLLLH